MSGTNPIKVHIKRLAGKPIKENADTLMDGIKCYMSQIIRDFFELRMTGACHEVFWDYIVISAADKEQKNGFELQLSSEIRRGLLPTVAQYLVIEDLPSKVLGAGGSTFHVLNTLEKQIKDIHCKRILLIHAGGFSKRLPNLSCIGKLFCPLPLDFNGKAISLLCLKIILITPFLKLMKQGGLFICASDDIEPYNAQELDKLVNNELHKPELIALAHPSSIFIGSTHGVYVLPAESASETKKTFLSSCLEVLQKPSYELMKERGATRTLATGEIVYTDSMFLCTPQLVRKMLSFAHECEGLYNEETCIYGDFLACMGSRPDEEKVYFKQVCSSSMIKQKIAENFSRTDASILVLQQSHFIHLGTMPEYIESLSPNGLLFKYLGMKPCVGSRVHASAKLLGVTVNCLVEAPVETLPESIMENCILRKSLICESRTILSNCFVEDAEVENIPAEWLFHTTSIKEENIVLFVTIAFMITDDLKGAVNASNSWRHVRSVPADTPLWRAKLFQAKETMGQSFYTTWQKVTRKLKENVGESSMKLFSMNDVVKLKYLPAILEHRQYIEQQIQS